MTKAASKFPNVRKSMTIPEFLKVLKKANQELRLVYELRPGWKEQIDGQWVWRRIIMCRSPFPYHNIHPEGVVFRHLFPDRIVPSHYDSVNEMIGLSRHDAEMIANACMESVRTNDKGKRIRFSRKLREDLLEACDLQEEPFESREAPPYGQGI